jgi:hypothetical protein
MVACILLITSSFVGIFSISCNRIETQAATPWPTFEAVFESNVLTAGLRDWIREKGKH